MPFSVNLLLFKQMRTDYAARNGHLITLACGEIATAAGVARLVVFHFSHRYVVIPKSVSLFEPSAARESETMLKLNLVLTFDLFDLVMKSQIHLSVSLIYS